MYDIEITKREVLVSIIIIVVMITIGVFINGNIQTTVDDRNKKYETAIEITDSDLFQYGMRTNVGNAFVEGDYEAVDTVSYPEIDGEYTWLRKDHEEYNMHVEHYTTTGPKGQIHHHTRTYWSWDLEDREEKEAEQIKFCGAIFPYSQIDGPGSSYIDTITEDSDTRYVYYGVGTEAHGSIFTHLKDNTISESNHFHQDTTAKQLREASIGSALSRKVLFWALWLVLTGFVVYAFYALDNHWLE